MISRCADCQSPCRVVQPSGPALAKFMFIGERPGQDELRIGAPFVGKSGRELDETYLRLAGMDRSECYITNTVLCGDAQNKRPSDKEIIQCSRHHIGMELEQAAPQVLFLLGGTACKLFGDLDLEIMHGYPQWRAGWGWEGWIVPMYHPASGMHDTGMMIPMLEDWEKVGMWMRGEWEPPEPEQIKPTYRLIQSRNDFETAIWPTDDIPGIAVDTEKFSGAPWSLQFSQSAGTGAMILAGRKDLLHLFRRWSNGREFILHNAGQDLDTLDLLGIRPAKFSDTMQEAYHQGNLPQGLKALAYRLFGIRMQSYQDVVLPHSLKKLEGWVEEALLYAMEHCKVVEEKQLKTKVKRIEKPGDEERALKRILRHLNSPTYDPWEKLVEVEAVLGGTAAWDGLVTAMGEWPEIGIEHVPLEQAVEYGCRDADMTLRVKLELERRRRMGDVVLSEGDEDQ